VNIWVLKLGITTQKQGKRAYITLPDLNELDRLSQHLSSGGKLAEFDGIVEEPAQPTIAPLSLKAPPQLLEMMAMMKALSEPKDPLVHWSQLEKACENNWLLSSSEIEQLLGLRPTSERWERGSFVFIRSGRIGRETSYRVEKR
jgi:hypothetical protein